MSIKNVLVITDCHDKIETSRVKSLFEGDDHTITVVEGKRYWGMVEKRWDAIVVWFDSASGGRGVARIFREASHIHHDTPIVYVEPAHPFDMQHIYRVHDIDFAPEAIGNVFKTQAKLRRKTG